MLLYYYKVYIYILHIMYTLGCTLQLFSGKWKKERNKTREKEKMTWEQVTLQIGVEQRALRQE